MVEDNFEDNRRKFEKSSFDINYCEFHLECGRWKKKRDFNFFWFLFFLSKGPTQNPDYVFPAILQNYTTYISNTVVGVSAFTIGLFLYHRQFLSLKLWSQITLHLIAKLFLLPCLYIGCAAIVGVTGDSAKIGLALSSMPVAFSAFTLAKQYGLGEELMSAEVTGNFVFCCDVRFKKCHWHHY